MKSLLVGIILFVVITLGGIIALSFMDVDVPQDDMIVDVTPANMSE